MLEQATKLQQTELERLVKIYLKQNKDLSKDASLINRNQKLIK